MMKKMLAIPILFLLCMGTGWNTKPPHPLYQQYKYPNEHFFGKQVYSEILYEYTDEEKSVGDAILETARAIFSHLGGKDRANDTVGALFRYYFNEDMASEEHGLELVAVKLEGPAGWMWVAYHRRAFDSNGNLAYGSGSQQHKILARWELNQADNGWIVTKVSEAP